MTLRLPWLAGLFAAFVLLPVFSVPAASFAAIPVYAAKVVRAYPHDRAAFTEGLFYLDGWLYESTGQNTRPAVRNRVSDQETITIMPTRPTSGSMKVHPNPQAADKPKIVSTEVSASASTCT